MLLLNNINVFIIYNIIKSFLNSSSTFIVCKLEQCSKIFFIFFTFDISNIVKSISFKLEQFLNIFSIFLTFFVQNEDKFIFIKLEQL